MKYVIIVGVDSDEGCAGYCVATEDAIDKARDLFSLFYDDTKSNTFDTFAEAMTFVGNNGELDDVIGAVAY